jgi:MFS family permease
MAIRNALLINPFVRRSLTLLFAAEAVNSVAGALLTVGLPFYMNHRFGWGAKENFAMAACQGALYVSGALSAKRISGRWGRERSFLALCACMTAFALAVGISSSMFWPVTMALLVAIETGLMAASWPMLESLVSAAGDPSQLSRRLGCYNIVWASMGAIALAATGAIIQHSPAWVFFGAVGAGHFTAGILVLYRTRSMPRVDDRNLDHAPAHDEPRPLPDEAVVRQHRLALWLSRIALPSTYVIVFSLAPALPSLHAIKQLSPTFATMVACVWFIARAAAFVITGNTTFWHKRPWLMFLASITMLISFLGTIIPGAMTGIGLSPALIYMAIAQIGLGLSIGTIYAASLYFGMAVSEGSTEHGGYHEALIGLGQILGPTVGATMQWIHPGALWPAVFGIAGVVSVTVVVEAVVGLRVSGGNAENTEHTEGHGRTQKK